MNRTRALVLAGLVAGALPPLVPAADSYAQSRIGRLFSTPEQRIALDMLRDEPASGEIAAPVPVRTDRESLPEPEGGPPAFAATLDGIVVRSDGHRLTWVDGVETTTGGVTPAGVRVTTDHTPGGSLRIRLSRGATSAVLEPGQSVDVNGRVRAVYERRPARATGRPHRPADSPLPDFRPPESRRSSAASLSTVQR